MFSRSFFKKIRLLLLVVLLLSFVYSFLFFLYVVKTMVSCLIPKIILQLNTRASVWYVL